MWRHEDLYQTIAGSFVGDNDKFTNKKKIPHITKTNGVTSMASRKQVDTSRRSKLQWSREGGRDGGRGGGWRQKPVLVELGTRYATSIRLKYRFGGKKTWGKWFYNWRLYCSIQIRQFQKRISKWVYFSPTNWMAFIKASLSVSLPKNINIRPPTVLNWNKFQDAHSPVGLFQE